MSLTSGGRSINPEVIAKVPRMAIILHTMEIVCTAETAIPIMLVLRIIANMKIVLSGIRWSFDKCLLCSCVYFTVTCFDPIVAWITCYIRASFIPAFHNSITPVATKWPSIPLNEFIAFFVLSPKHFEECYLLRGILLRLGLSRGH